MNYKAAELILYHSGRNMNKNYEELIESIVDELLKDNSPNVQLYYKEPAYKFEVQKMDYSTRGKIAVSMAASVGAAI